MRILKTLLLAGTIFSSASLESAPARATTLVSTKLSDLAGLSQAVVQGEIVGSTNLIDTTGTPWTIYTLAVESVLAGSVESKLLGFRCIGGTVGDRALVMVGTPRLVVGDNIVAFLKKDGLCQVSGLEFGVFWKRKDLDGQERLVDFLNRAVAAMDGDGVVPSELVVPRAFDANEPIPETHTSNASEKEADTFRPPPAAPVAAVLSEMKAFSIAYVKKPELLRSTVDLSELPQLGPTRAPEAAP